jgi:hypothetical protein
MFQDDEQDPDLLKNQAQRAGGRLSTSFSPTGDFEAESAVIQADQRVELRSAWAP